MFYNNNLSSPSWKPIDNGTLVSIRDEIQFGILEPKYGRIIGWHINVQNSEILNKSNLDYQIELIKRKNIGYHLSLYLGSLGCVNENYGK